MKTWVKEILVVGIILCACTLIFANNLVNWLTTAAVLFTFNHAQIGDRLKESQQIIPIKTVKCYRKLNWLFSIKEVLWIIVFILIHNHSAIIGSVLFAIYPLWRKLYRSKIKPLS